MPGRVKVLDVELGRQLETIGGLDGYLWVLALVRVRGTPIGYVRLPVFGGRCVATVIRQAVAERLAWPVVRHLLIERLAAPLDAAGIGVDALGDPPQDPPQAAGSGGPLVTVAVCTRDRPTELAVCLESLAQLDYPALDLLVVDNAPSSDASERLVRSRHPRVRYLREPRPGLDWARNRAVMESRGEIIAFADDDVVVDPGWVNALVRVFLEEPAALAVTGLVVPLELETQAQLLFEQYGGFGRGFRRRWWHRAPPSERRPADYHGGAGVFGTGANMAFRRRTFEQLGLFDPALDVGTPSDGGGDLELFFRVLQEGHTLVYEPAAIVRHRHRRRYAELHRQLTTFGTGFWAYMFRSALAYPGERPAFARLATWWIWRYSLRQLVASCFRPISFPRELIAAELRGALISPGRYLKARRTAAAVAARHGPLGPRRAGAPAGYTLDLCRPLDSSSAILGG